MPQVITADRLTVSSLHVVKQVLLFYDKQYLYTIDILCWDYD